MKRFMLTLFVIAALTFVMLPLISSAQDKPNNKEEKRFKPDVSQATRHDVSKPLREMVPLKAGKARKYENPMNFAQKGAASDQQDGALQSTAFPNVAGYAGLNFEGVGEGLAGL